MDANPQSTTHNAAQLGSAGHGEHRDQARNIETWQRAVESEIEALGWQSVTRVEQPGEDVTIYVVDAVVEHDLTFRPEGPATFSLSVFLDGAGTLSIDGATPCPLTPGLGVLFTSNRYTRGENTVPAGQRFHVVDMRFENSILMRAGGAPLARLGGDLMTEHSLPEDEVFLIGFPAPVALLQVARDIAACAMPAGLGRRLYLYGKTIEALGIVVSCLQDASNAKTAVRSVDRGKIEEARRLVNETYARDWTIARLAREVGLNERQLKQGFRRIVGNSVHAYLRDVRLDAAAALLREGHSVTQAALAVGFDNLSHFSKTFRDAKGILPSQYARRIF